MDDQNSKVKNEILMATTTHIIVLVFFLIIHEPIANLFHNMYKDIYIGTIFTVVLIVVLFVLLSLILPLLKLDISSFFIKLINSNQYLIYFLLIFCLLLIFDSNKNWNYVRIFKPINNDLVIDQEVINDLAEFKSNIPNFNEQENKLLTNNNNIPLIGINLIHLFHFAIWSVIPIILIIHLRRSIKKQKRQEKINLTRKYF